MISPWENLTPIYPWLIPTINFSRAWVAQRGAIFAIIAGVSRHRVTGSKSICQSTNYVRLHTICALNPNLLNGNKRNLKEI